jgi:MFS family permease
VGIQNYPNFVFAAALSLALGLVVSPIMIASNTIIHNSSDNAMRGKIFSSMEMVMHLGFLLFMFLSSLLAEKVSHVLILVVIGCVFSILGIINFIYNKEVKWLR